MMKIYVNTCVITYKLINYHILDTLYLLLYFMLLVLWYERGLIVCLTLRKSNVCLQIIFGFTKNKISKCVFIVIILGIITVYNINEMYL